MPSAVELLLTDTAAQYITLFHVDPIEPLTGFTRVATPMSIPPVYLGGSSSIPGLANPATVTPSPLFPPGSGVDRILVVRSANDTGAIASVTYGGVALTLAASHNVGGTSTVEIWYLVNPLPPDGARSVVVTYAVQPSDHAFHAGFYRGVNPATPFGAAVKNSGTSTTPSTTVASATNELVIDVVATPGAPGAVGGGQTARLYTSDGTISELGSDEPGAASTVMSWTIGSSSPWVSMAMALKPGTSLAYSKSVDEVTQASRIPGGMFAEIIGVVQNDVVLTVKASLALVEGSPESYYYDRAAKILYMQTTTGDDPDVYTFIGALRRVRISSDTVNFSDQPLYYPLLTGGSPQTVEDASQPIQNVAPFQSGQLQFANANGLFDALDGAWVWHNRPVTMYFGGVRSNGYALTFAEYLTIGQMLIADTAAGDLTFDLKLVVDDQIDSSLPFFTWRTSGLFSEATIALFNDPAIASNYLPVIGGRVFDIPLIGYRRIGSDEYWAAGMSLTISPGFAPVITQIRAVSKASGVVTVVPSGNILATDMFSIFVMGYTSDLYDLYADLEEYQADTYGRVGSMTKSILFKLGIDVSRVDYASMDAADVAAPFMLGLYVPGGQFPTVPVAQAFAAIASSVLARTYYGTDGKWHTNVWDPTGDAATTPVFTEADLQSWQPVAKLETVVATVYVTYAEKVNAKQTNRVSVTSADARYRQQTRKSATIDTLLTDSDAATIMASRFLARLSQPTTKIEITERGATLLTKGTWNKIQVTRSRAPSPTGTFDRERFELLRLTKQYTPTPTVSALIGDQSGLRERYKQWAPSAITGTTWAAATDAQKHTYMFWADSSGAVGGSTDNAFRWW